MKRWAQIVNGEVANMVVQLSAPTFGDGSWVDVTGQPIRIGDKDDGSGVFVTPVVVELPRHITQLAFARRFSTAERVRLKLAAVIDPSATTEARAQAAAIAVYVDDVFSATYIDLDRIDTRAGVEALQLIPGMLDGPGRAAEILDNPVQSHERYKGAR